MLRCKISTSISTSGTDCLIDPFRQPSTTNTIYSFLSRQQQRYFRSTLMSAINILIYSGNGTSPNSVRHTHQTLKSLLGHAYDIVKVDSKALSTEPWEETCAMLVIPGGRDMPYCTDLNGALNSRIKNYVHGGGRYLGLCAGGYYASKTIEFEQDRPDMQVCGNRELEFFPGLCRGTIYPGFVYDSERGARCANIQLMSDKLQPYYPGLVPKVVSMYYNGGGYFAHADKYPNVEILGRFLEPGICKDEENPACVVQCKVGQGTALLISTHPEYEVASMQTHENQALVDELRASEADRKGFLVAAFARIGLKVVGHDENRIQENRAPDLTPIYLSAVQGQIAQSVAGGLYKISKDSIIKDSNDTFYLTKSDSDELCSRLENMTVEEGAVLPLQIRIPDCSADPACPDRSVTPHFDINAYFKALLDIRSKEWGGGKWYRFGNTMLYSEVITSTQTILDRYVLDVLHL